MRKLIVCLLLVAMVAALSACGKSEKSASGKITSYVLSANLPASTTTVSVEDDIKESDDITVSENPADKYLGEWNCENGTLEITKDGEAYSCKIKYTGNENEVKEWSYPLSVSDLEGTFTCENGGKCVSKNNDDTSENIDYVDGSCSLLIFDNKMLWIDDKDHFGDDLTFIKK